MDFAAPALAHQSQGLSRPNLQVDAVDGLHPADDLLKKTSSNGKILLEPFNPEKGMSRLIVLFHHWDSLVGTGQDSGSSVLLHSHTMPDTGFDRDRSREGIGDGNGHPAGL